MKPLEGKLSVVTGVGRPEGIGTAICRALAAAGSDIFYTYYQPYDTLNHPESEAYDRQTLTSELQSLGVRARAVEIDLAANDVSDRLLASVQAALGVPTILINNAAHDVASPIHRLTSEVLDAHYAVNLRATALLCVAFLNARHGDEGGVIINLTSGQDLGPMNVDQIPYTITKAGVEMLTKQLAPECARVGVRIHAVDPGPTDTGWMTPELKRTVAASAKSGRINTSSDAANLILSMLFDYGLPNGSVIHAER